MIMTMSVLFNFFSNLMICYWAKNKTEQGLATELGLRNPYQAKDYVIALKNYNALSAWRLLVSYVYTMPNQKALITTLPLTGNY
jgi:hypothetical protein